METTAKVIAVSGNGGCVKNEGGGGLGAPPVCLKPGRVEPRDRRRSRRRSFNVPRRGGHAHA